MSGQSILKLRPDVTIIPLAVEHAAKMYCWMGDPVVAHNLGLRSEPSLEKTISWITYALQDPLIQPLAVLLSGQHVGNVILDRIDTYLATARMSVYIGESSARGAGVGLTAVYLALAEGFKNLNLYKIWLTVHTRNFPAINVYSRLGFVLEGILRGEFWLDGQRVDVLYMGLLHTDFKQLVIDPPISQLKNNPSA